MDAATRAAELADMVAAAHGRVMSFAAGCSDADWTSVCPGETWPIGVVLDHIADGYRAFDGWIRGYLEGHPVPVTREQIEAMNAEHAVATATRPRLDTVTHLASASDSTIAVVRGLSDDQLAIAHPMALRGGDTVSAEQLVLALLRHTAGHLQSCQQALGR